MRSTPCLRSRRLTPTPPSDPHPFSACQHFYPEEKRKEQMDALFAADGAAYKHLANFNKVLGGKASFTSVPTAGELAVVGAINILKVCAPQAAARGR